LCGAREGWRRSVEMIVWKKYYMEFREKGVSLHKIKIRKADCIGHILCRNFLLKHVTEGKIKKI